MIELKWSLEMTICWRNKKYSKLNNWAISAKKDRHVAKIRTVKNIWNRYRKELSEVILSSDQIVLKNPTNFGKRLLASRHISNKCFQFLIYPRLMKRTFWLIMLPVASLSTRSRIKSTLESLWEAMLTLLKIQRSSMISMRASIVFQLQLLPQLPSFREKSKSNSTKTQAKKTTNRLE